MTTVTNKSFDNQDRFNFVHMAQTIHQIGNESTNSAVSSSSSSSLSPPINLKEQFDSFQFGQASHYNIRKENSMASASSSQMRGWGSVESRKPCSCLSSLANTNNQEPISRAMTSNQPTVGNENGWGFFENQIDF